MENRRDSKIKREGGGKEGGTEGEEGRGRERQRRKERAGETGKERK